jgi:hypothetical protein
VLNEAARGKSVEMTGSKPEKEELGRTCHRLMMLMVEAVTTTETSVNSYQSTRRYNPEDSHIHNYRSQNLKSYLNTTVLKISDSPYFPTFCIIMA